MLAFGHAAWPRHRLLHVYFLPLSEEQPQEKPHENASRHYT